jgi:hypothetical protein
LLPCAAQVEQSYVTVYMSSSPVAKDRAPGIFKLLGVDASIAQRTQGRTLLIGSNANEAGAMITDLDTTTVGSFEKDITRRFGKLPAQLLAAYPWQTSRSVRPSPN